MDISPQHRAVDFGDPDTELSPQLRADDRVKGRAPTADEIFVTSLRAQLELPAPTEGII